MYKVLIIDDEPWIIDGIKKTVAWENEGFTIVGDAEDAFEGIDKISELKPDVVFVDIRMPEMSGLEMINKVREKGLDTEFVIISGYSEFSYARESISLGVLEYVLKPIQKEELKRILSKLKARLDAKRRRISFDNTELLEQLAQTGNSEERTVSLLNQLGINDVSCIKRTAFVKLPDESAFFRKLDHEGLGMTVMPISDGSCFMTMSYVAMNDLTIQGALLKCIKNMKYAGISGEITGLDKIHLSIHEAELAAANGFIFDNENVFFYKKPDYQAVTDFAGEIARGLAGMDFSAVHAYTENLKSLLAEKRWGVEEVCFIYNFILQHMVCESSNRYEGFMDYMTAETIVRDFRSFHDFEKFLKNVLTSFEELKLGSNSSKYNETIKNVISYINAHFHEEIRLVDVSNMFFINSNYLSIVFRQTTGKTFSQYLAEVRMRKASELLVQTGMSIEEICSSVGYTDYYSFIKAFKKVYGITPGKFKREGSKI